MEKTQQLRDPNIKPTDRVIAEAIGNAHSAYEKFINHLTDHNIAAEWRYYKDGKAWLAKAQAKKKTICWISVWKGFFMASFFFTEKTRAGIQGLVINHDLKEKFAKAAAVGKLIPLVFEISTESQLQDVFSVIEYKKNLK